MVTFPLKDTLLRNRETLTAGFPNIPASNPDRKMNIGIHTADNGQSYIIGSILGKKTMIKLM
jgi:hypothetical protein